MLPSLLTCTFATGTLRYFFVQVLFVKNRVVFLNSTVDIKMARSIVARLLYLDSENNQPIQLIINSPGGSVSSGLAIYDTMKAINSPVHTYVPGRAFVDSAGAGSLGV